MSWSVVLRWFLAIAVISMGILHLTFAHTFERAVPEYLPGRLALAIVSGFCEIGLGVGLLFPQTRNLSAVGLIALFVAVFPANIGMAIHADQWVASKYTWLLWMRLPFQALFIYWAWCSRL